MRAETDEVGRSSDYWDSDARRVAAVTSSASLHRERRRVEALAAALVRSVPRGATVLDAGMGDGALLTELARLGYHAVGVDVSSVRVAAAERRLGASGLEATVVSGSLTELPFEDASLDAAVCSEVMEHLGSPQLAASELSRVIKPNGFVVVSVPWEEELGIDICTECGAQVPRHGHIVSYSVDSLSCLMTAAGFTVHGRGGLGSGPLLRGPAAGLAATLPFGVWVACDWLARRVFTPEWIVMEAQKPAVLDQGA